VAPNLVRISTLKERRDKREKSTRTAKPDDRNLTNVMVAVAAEGQRTEKGKDKGKHAERRSSLVARKTCKSRPDSRKATKGSGGSRAFVPWCDKKT